MGTRFSGYSDMGHLFGTTVKAKKKQIPPHSTTLGCGMIKQKSHGLSGENDDFALVG